MVEKTFINPSAVLGALTPKPVVKTVEVVDLGPSAPHDDDAAEGALALELPPNPWAPTPTPHYTQVLDELWPEFDDPEERTAARLTALVNEVVDEATNLFELKQQLWDSTSAWQIPMTEVTRFDREFLAYLRRLGEYRRTLESLEPGSTDTQSIYVGLVKRREGAGPVPDAIMHLYFAQQLGILAEHADDMSSGFVGRVMTALNTVDDTIEGIQDAAADKAAQIQEKLDEVTTAVGSKLRRAALIVGGIFVGTIVVGGTIIVAIVAGRSRK